jgi:hypothetical protein
MHSTLEGTYRHKHPCHYRSADNRASPETAITQPMHPASRNFNKGMPMYQYHLQTLALSRMHSTLEGTYRHRHPYQPPQRRQSCSSRDCNHATDASCTHATVNTCHAHHDNAQLSFPDTCTIIYMHYIRVYLQQTLAS